MLDLPPGYTDVHKATVDLDETFQTWMDSVDAVMGHTEDWRTRLSDKQKRIAAKNWNFARLYGAHPEVLLGILCENNEKK